MSCRSTIACLLAVLATTACDRTPPAPQASPDNRADASVPAPDEAVAPAAPAATVAKLDRSHKGEAAPTLAFAAPDGKPVTLAAFTGKPLLVNLWATWCVPCVVELPTLDKAAQALRGKVTVLAISQDSDAAKVAPFLAGKKLALEPYVDAKMGLSLGYQASLPMTILFGADGREVWRRSGEFDWTSAEAKALIAEAR